MVSFSSLVSIYRFWVNRADEIEVELTRQHYRQHSEDERAY